LPQALRAERERQKKIAERTAAELEADDNGLPINAHRDTDEKPIYIHRDLEVFLKKVQDMCGSRFYSPL
jgi:hypothetical protein